MPILLLGMSHQTTPVELREKFYIQENALKYTMQAVRNFSSQIEECIIISTCNRLELYCVGMQPAQLKSALMAFLAQHYAVAASDLEPYCYVRQDAHAVEHLMRVVTGLESLVLGEDQILGQVTKASQIAIAGQSSGALLNRLFSSASHVGKRARTETDINRYTTSVSHAAAHLIRQHCGDVSKLRVLLLGAGEMAEIAAKAMMMQGFQGLIIANRTFERAQALASKVSGSAIRWPQVYQQIAQVDVVLTATGAPHTVLHAQDLQPILEQRNGGPDLLMVDVSVPRNIEPMIDQLERVRVFDIDALQRVLDDNMAQRQANVPSVEFIIEQELANFMRWWQEREAVPTIDALRTKIKQMAADELDIALSRLSYLDEHEHEVIKKLLHRVVNKMLHQPTVSLRQHASMVDYDGFAQTLREIFDLPAEQTAAEAAQADDPQPFTATTPYALTNGTRSKH